jgi:fructuronate reductase
VRFGETLKARVAAGLPVDNLRAVPLFVALWLRYRQGTDDMGAPMTLSPDPRIPEAFSDLTNLRPILSDAQTFGVDLYEVGLGDTIADLYEQMAEPGGVSKVLDSFMGGASGG